MKHLNLMAVLFITSIISASSFAKNSSQIEKWDILFVVDDSASMTVHQNWLSRSAAGLLNTLDCLKVDYHLAVTTTSQDSEQGKLMGPVISSTTEQKETQFQNQLSPGTAGSGIEKAFDGIVYSLRNNEFRRKNSNLLVVVVSDAEDQSSTEVRDVLTETKYLNHGQHEDVFFVAVHASAENGCQKDDIIIEPLKFLSLINETEGDKIPICDPLAPMKINDTLKKIIIENR